MYRGWPVIKREFVEMARTRMFILGTILGPFLIVLMMTGPLMLMRAGGGGERNVLVLDASGAGIGAEIAAALDAMDPDDMGGMGSRFTTEVRTVRGEATAEREAARARIGDEAAPLDGYLYLPPSFMETAAASYEGRNATSQFQMQQVQMAAQRALQGRRIAETGVDPRVVARIIAPVQLDTRKPGSDEKEGATEIFYVGLMLAMAIYFAVVLFAAAVMRGVLEEKRDRIVEVLLSSIRAREFMVGKVLGIGGASLFQMLVWAGFAAAAVVWGPALAARYDTAIPNIPDIPMAAVVSFLFFFVTGFLLYAAMFGAAGAIATSDQEANQLQFPVTVPLLIGIFIMYSMMADPDNPIAVAGTLIPFTAPVVVPVRAMMTEIPAVEYAVSAVLMVVTVAGATWMAAKIYRIGVLSTGKKPTMKELVRWLRTA